MKRLRVAVRNLILLPIIGGLVVSTIMIPPLPVGAVGPIGPDPGDFNPGTNLINLVVSTTADVSIVQTTVKLYFNAASGAFRVHDARLCLGAAGTAANDYDNPGAAVNGASSTRYELFRATHTIAGSGVETEARGALVTNVVIPASSAGNCKSLFVNFSVGGLSRGRDHGKYVAYLRITNLIPNTQNAFRVETTTNGFAVGYDSGIDPASFGMNQVRPLSGNTDYSLRFASDCYVPPAGEVVAARWFDDDNGVAGIQPVPTRFQLRKYAPGSASYTLEPFISFRTDPGGAPIPWSESGGWYTAFGGNGVKVRATFRAQPGYRYNWVWDNIYYNNTVQFQIPFDSIFYLTGCQRPGGKLRAGMTATPSTISQGETATFTPSINVSEFSNSFTVNCTIRRTVRPAGGAAADVGAQPCVDTTGNPNIPITSGGTKTLRANTYSSLTDAPGSQVCDTITITVPADADYYNLPAHRTAQRCVVIAKSPYVHFRGNDVWAGGGFVDDAVPVCNSNADIQTASRMLSDGSIAGSAGEYGAFALGVITEFGSANKAFLDPGPIGKILTFSNTSPTLGNFGATPHCINNYVTEYESAPNDPGAPGAINVGARPSGKWHLAGARSFSGAMPAGSQQIYLVDGDVTITGNITYPGSYASAAAIPSLIIITKGKITVQSGVTQIDGVYIAKGTFDTCNPPAAVPLSTTICNNQLVINGPVIARKLNLLRTHGADGATNATRKIPAEVFNFNSELYIRNALSGTNSGLQIRTVDQRDLPPRY